MKKQKFLIEDMHCTSCAMNIDFELEDVKGVQKSQTSYVKRICDIEYDESYVTEKVIIEVIQKTGYRAKLID
jgi:copper chaperone CopZ